MKILALLLVLLSSSCVKREVAPDLAVYTGQGFQLINVESNGARVLLLFGENLDSAQSLLEQARHDPTVAQF
jgi:hypothetical protein